MTLISRACRLFAIYAVASVFVLGLAEVVIRNFVADDHWSKARAANVLVDVSLTYRVDNLYSSDNPTITYRRNRYGLRGSCVDNYPIDILTIGGSTTDQRYLSLENTFQELLMRKIENRTGKVICIANAGVDGHSTKGHLYSFDHWFPLIPNLKPSFVLLYIGINDVKFEDVNKANKFEMRDDGFRLANIVRSSAVLSKLLPIYYFVRSKFPEVPYGGHGAVQVSENAYAEESLSPGIEKLNDINLHRFQENFLALLERVENLGSIPLCVTQPHRFVRDAGTSRMGWIGVFERYNGLDFEYILSNLNRVMAEHCGKYFIEVASEEFEAEDFYDLTHTTPAGSERLAELLASRIIDIGIETKED